MESKAPSFCRLCNISLASPSVWRQHAKNDWHVYNLRVKVAEPGTIITPPSSSPRRPRSQASNQSSYSEQENESGQSEYDSECDDAEPLAALQFKALHCLFCSTVSGSFDSNLQHMTKTHSFTIPYQEHLTVDLETIAAYLQLVIYGYRECIQCGSQRRTVEGIQHHMTAKGHCRFDISSDMEEFYNIPSHNYTTDAESLLLPSGKLLSNPTKVTGPFLARTPRPSTRRRMALTTLPSSRSKPPQADLLAHEGTGAPLSSGTQLSRLTKGDQQSLSYLKNYQVRALVATGARAIDESRREAKHSELKLSKAGNITLMGTFRADTSKRFRGPWG